MMTRGKALLERRIKMMGDHVLGVNKPEIFRSLAIEYGVSYHAIYKDFQRRGKWLVDVLEVRDSRIITLDIVALLHWLKRRGVMEVMQGKTGATRVGAIRTVADIATRIYNILKDSDIEMEIDVQDDVTQLLEEYKDIYEEETGETYPLQENRVGKPMDSLLSS